MASVSLLGRVARFAALATHFANGLLTLACGFPRYSDARKSAEILNWSRKFLRLTHVRVEHTGQVPKAGLIVMNHISWLDVVVLNALAPSRFVAKSEVAKWPFVGYLCTKSGTLYIERSRKTAARRTNQLITEALLRGERVAVFPEGTTSPGDTLLQFHAALLQPAIASGGLAYPASLRYLGTDGLRSNEVSYGDESLLGSVWKLLDARCVTARVAFGSPEQATGRHRRELASALHAAISHGLTPDSRDRGPETDAGLPP
jgi:1-acyl-sn-glycerol-3-phosphate acyltransferase